jgi:DNA-binding NarL/FixJ family response regulator
LIVDDSDIFLDSLERYLGTVPSIDVVGRACSAAEAITKVRVLQPDLVFMDLVMPRRNGLEATREIKSLDNPPYIIIVSPDANGEYSASARAAGADGLVSKGEFSDSVMGVVEGLFRAARESRIKAAG